MSAENDCEYCVAAHSTVATMVGVPEQILSALRDGTPADNARLDALVRLARAIVRTRGNVPEGTVDEFLASGFTKDQLGEVLVGVGLKTISNYFNALAGTPLDDAFKPQAWRAGIV